MNQSEYKAEHKATTDLAITRSEVLDVIDMLQRKEDVYPID